MKLREISRTISVSVDGKPREFRLTKLDAFSGASLLRLMARLPEGGASVEALFSCLSDADLRSLMTVCLEHAEVLLPAGWIAVMTRGEWSYAELEEALWTLEGFFGGGASVSRTEAPDT